ncbi:MAG: hypothetical protein ABL908_18620, partial [Hyphomicrobium sp.]
AHAFGRDYGRWRSAWGVLIAAFSDIVGERLVKGDIPLRKADLRAIIDCVEVDEGTIRLFGRKDVLEQCVMAGTSATPGVRTFVPEWRPVGLPYFHSLPFAALRIVPVLSRSFGC